MSANLDFKRTFQYFQALYSVVRISSQLFIYDIDNVIRVRTGDEGVDAL